MLMSTMTAGDAVDRAFAGVPCEIVRDDGRVRPFAVEAWMRPADAADVALFLADSDATTLDIGCGPGRLTVAMTARCQPAMGIDVSRVALRLARQQGAAVLRRDVFGEVPGTGRWERALLADGNIGLGGDPVVLLQRVRTLLRPGGAAVVEVAPPGRGVRTHQARMRAEGVLSTPFRWATVGVDAIAQLGWKAGLDLMHVNVRDNRWVAELQRPQEVRSA